MIEKYCTFVLPKTTQMENNKFVSDYSTFLKEEIQNKENDGVSDGVSDGVNDGKDIKLFYTLETKRIEIPVGGETSIKSEDKKSTFEKIIKRITKISKFIKLPVPVLTLIEKKKYYTFVSFGEHSINYYHDNFSNGKNYTDDLSEIEKVKSTLKTKLTGKSSWQITSKDIEVYDLTMATVIKPEDEWIILGTFDYVDGLLKAAPGQQIPIDIVNMEKSECDHCHKNIYRKKTVFIKKIKDGSIIKVGGTCIKNYLGYDYEKVLTYLTDLSFINESWDNEGGIGFDDYDGGFGGGHWVETEVSVREIVRYYIWWYNNRGYMSKSSAEKINNKIISENPNEEYHLLKLVNSTGDLVRKDVDYANTPPRGRGSESEFKDWSEWLESTYNPRLESISDDNPYIQNFIDFIEANKDNNFLFNVSNMIKQGVVKIHLTNYITGGCSFYFGKLFSEEQKRKSEMGEGKEPQKPSEWVGSVGEKMKFENLEIVHIGGFETQYGWSNVYKLKDQNGNIYTKFGTIGTQYIVKPTENGRQKDEQGNLVINDILVGDVISATADVKNHDEYQGKKQTVLGRLSKLK